MGYENIAHWTTLINNINLGLLAPSSSGTTESIWASPPVQAPRCPERATHGVCLWAALFLFIYFFYTVWARVRSLLPGLQMLAICVYVIFLHCVILNPVISSCLVGVFFYCLCSCIIDLLTARCLLSMFLDKQLLTLWLWTVTISFLRFSSWLTCRSTTWWRWHVISLFCFTRLDFFFLPYK